MKISNFQQNSTRSQAQPNFKKHINIAIPLTELSNSQKDVDKLVLLSTINELFTKIAESAQEKFYVKNTDTHRILSGYIEDRIDLTKVLKEKPELKIPLKEALVLEAAGKNFELKPNEIALLTESNEAVDAILLNLKTQRGFDNLSKPAIEAKSKYPSAITVESEEKSKIAEFRDASEAFAKRFKKTGTVKRWQASNWLQQLK